jgi:hypothetical protein
MPPISAAGTPVLAFKSNCVCRPETPATSSAGMDALRSPCRSCPEILEAAADNGLAFLQHEHGESLSVSRLKFWQQKARCPGTEPGSRMVVAPGWIALQAASAAASRGACFEERLAGTSMFRRVRRSALLEVARVWIATGIGLDGLS